jgi:hypothetical protein
MHANYEIHVQNAPRAMVNPRIWHKVLISENPKQVCNPLNSKQQRLSRFQNLKSTVVIEPNCSLHVSVDPRPIFSPSYVFTVSGDLFFFPFSDFLSLLSVSRIEPIDCVPEVGQRRAGVAVERRNILISGAFLLPSSPPHFPPSTKPLSSPEITFSSRPP